MTPEGEVTADRQDARYAPGMQTISQHAVRRLIMAMTCAAVAAALTGCSANVRPPTFSILSAAVTDTSDAGFVVSFTLRGENTNDVAIPLRTIEYTVKLNDKLVFKGTRSAEATLPRFGSQTITLPAAISFDRFNAPHDDPVSDGVTFEFKGAMAYLSPGQLAQILFDTGLRQPTAIIHERGVFEEIEPEPATPSGQP